MNVSGNSRPPYGLGEAERFAAGMHAVEVLAGLHGLEPDDVGLAFSHWRLAAISPGVYKRYLVGAMGERGDFDLESYKSSVTTRARTALKCFSQPVSPGSAKFARKDERRAGLPPWPLPARFVPASHSEI